MIEYWYNIFSEPWTRTTTIEKQNRDKDIEFLTLGKKSVPVSTSSFYY